MNSCTEYKCRSGKGGRIEIKWSFVKLQRFLEQNTKTEIVQLDRLYRLLGVRLEGEGPFIREERLGSQIRAKRLQRVRSGDFIYSRLFAWRGAFGIVRGDMDGAYVSNEFPNFKIDENEASPEFLRLFFKQRRVWNDVKRHCAGTTKASRNRFKEKFFLDFEIPLPPIEEQKRIVIKIESLVQRIEETRRLREKAIEETETLLNRTLATIFDELVDYYGLEQLDELVVSGRYGTSVKCTYERYLGSIPILRIPNIISEKISLQDLKFGMLEENTYKKLLLSEGDLLVVRTCGSADLVGRCAVVPKLAEPMAFASYLIRLRCNQKMVDPSYLQTMLRHLRISGKLFDFARTTAGQYNVSLKRLVNAQIPLPPLSVQHSFIDYLNTLQAKIDEFRKLQIETGKTIDELIPSILDQAFKGEL